MQIQSMLEQAAQHRPDKGAVHHEERWTTYGSIDRMANAVARILRECGASRGDRIGVLIENSVEYVAAYFGALKADCVAVSMSTDHRGDDLAYLFDHADTRIVLSKPRLSRNIIPALGKTGMVETLLLFGTVPSAYEQFKDIVVLNISEQVEHGEPSPPSSTGIDLDLAEIVYTSGSTGKPKGVMLSHLNLASNMKSIVEYFGLTPEDRQMVILPFNYIYGKSLLLSHVLIQGSIVIDNRFVYPNTVLENMRDTECTSLGGVPSTYMMLLSRSSIAEMEFPALRYVSQAGGAMAPSVQQQVVEAFAPAKLWVMYGATEAAPRLSYLNPEMLPQKLGSIGVPVPNVELAVVNADGMRVAPGETGEIIARGSNITAGYWKDPKGTAEVIKDGYYYTGDLGVVDEDGYFFVVGRSKDIIKVKGYRVSAKEIEERILEDADIEEVAVIAVDDSEMGEAPKAFVVVKKDHTVSADAIIGRLKQELPVYKLPREVEFIESMPKNESGKIMKTKLKERERKQQ